MGEAADEEARSKEVDDRGNRWGGKSLMLNQVEDKISLQRWGAVLWAVNLHSWMLPFPYGVMGKESADRPASFLSSSIPPNPA